MSTSNQQARGKNNNIQLYLSACQHPPRVLTSSGPVIWHGGEP